MKKPRAKKRWTVYILRCADGSLYTGLTRDLERRVVEHNSHALLAARYTRSRRPVVVVYREPAATRSAAARREYQIKQMTRRGKEELVRLPARSGPRPGLGARRCVRCRTYRHKKCPPRKIRGPLCLGKARRS